MPFTLFKSKQHHIDNQKKAMARRAKIKAGSANRVNVVNKTKRNYRAYPEHQGKQSTDPHSGGTILKLDDYTYCPLCSARMQRRQLRLHWKEYHTR